jgi:hypothetical protein
MKCTDGFTSRGAINLRGAQITGRMSLDKAVLEAPDSDRRDSSGLHPSLLHEAELDLRVAIPVIGGSGSATRTSEAWTMTRPSGHARWY